MGRVHAPGGAAQDQGRELEGFVLAGGARVGGELRGERGGGGHGSLRYLY